MALAKGRRRRRKRVLNDPELKSSPRRSRRRRLGRKLVQHFLFFLNLGLLLTPAKRGKGRLKKEPKYFALFSPFFLAVTRKHGV